MSQSMHMLTDMAVANMGQANVDTERQRIANLSNSQNKEQKEQELRKAAEGFEAIFIQKMWQQMRSSLPKNPLHHSKEEEYWQSMYDQELGKSMASAGGIGLADMMVQQLTQERYKSPPSKAMSRIRMAVDPAPLVPESNTAQANNAQPNQVQNKNINSAQQFNVNTIQSQPVNTQNLYETYNEQEVNAQYVHNNTPGNVGMASQQPTQAVAPQASQNMQASSAVQEAQAPRIVKTTYITNLPPSKREHAILDKNGRTIRKTTSPMQNKVMPARIPNTAEYIDRSLSIERNVKVNTPQNVEQVNLAQQTPPPVVQGSQNQIPIPNQIQQNNPIPNQNNDVLAGITTRYISQVERLAMIEASSILSQNVGTIYSPVEKNYVASQQEIQKENKQEAIINHLSNQIKTPTLEDALKIGTLVASLEPGERSQLEKVEPTIKKIIGGGPELASPPISYSATAFSPKVQFKDPLEQIEGMVSSSFGWRLDPITNKRAWHTGIDIKSPMGSPVSAVQQGTVSFAGVDPELGNTVIIDHGNGIQSVYGHNSAILVKKGETVNSGTQIARVGASGRTNGAHLHFEVRQNGLSINPEPYLLKEEIS